jgi:hypothetical protein
MIPVFAERSRPEASGISDAVEEEMLAVKSCSGETVDVMEVEKRGE